MSVHLSAGACIGQRWVRPAPTGIPVASSWPTWLLGTELGTSAEPISSHHHIFLTTKYRSKHLNLAAWKKKQPIFPHFIIYERKTPNILACKIKRKGFPGRGLVWHDTDILALSVFWLVLPSGWNNPEVLQALESKLLLTFCCLPLAFALL